MAFYTIYFTIAIWTMEQYSDLRQRLKRRGTTPNANLSKGNIRLAKTIADHGQKKKVADDWQWGSFCGWSLDFRIGILEAKSKIISIDSNPILFERENTKVLQRVDNCNI